MAPAVVTVGGQQLILLPPPSTDPVVVSATTITGVIPTAPEGAVDVAVMNPDGQGAILVDGYHGDSQVAELSSRAFYEDCGRRLDAGGVLVVNLWGSDRRFNEYLQRIEAAYPTGTLCLPAEKPGNVIVLAFRDRPRNPRWDELERRAGELTARHGLEFAKFVQALRKMNRSDAETLHVSGKP